MEAAGIPEYPGGKQTGLVSGGQSDSGGGKHFNALYSLPDSPEKVAAFYKDKLKFDVAQKGQVYQLVGKTATGSDVLMFIQPDGKGSKLSIKGILYEKR